MKDNKTFEVYFCTVCKEATDDPSDHIWNTHLEMALDTFKDAIIRKMNIEIPDD